MRSEKEIKDRIDKLEGDLFNIERKYDYKVLSVNLYSQSILNDLISLAQRIQDELKGLKWILNEPKTNHPNKLKRFK